MIFLTRGTMKPLNIPISTFFEKYLETVKRFIPKQEDKPLLGLDIGARSCQMVEVKKKGSSYELQNWAVEQNPSGDPKPAIKKLLTRWTGQHISPATAVSGKGCLIRFIDLPRMSPDDLKKSFTYEADKYFPFPRDQIYMDFYVVDEAAKDNKMSVLIAAVKKDLIDERIKLLSESGLQTEVISLNSIAVANAINVLGLKGSVPEKEKNPQAVAVLNLEELLTSLTILVDGRPQFNRDIFIGAKDFRRCICHNMQVAMDQAQRLEDDPGDQGPAVLQACDSAILDLVSELRLSFDYFVTDKNLPLSQVLLTGTGSGLEGLADVLARHLEIPVKPWNPLDYLSLGTGVSEDVRKHEKKLGVAIGLALYG